MQIPNRLFIDKKNFSYGFSRSGVFTIAEADLLEVYGFRMQELSSGKSEAETPDEILFVEEINTTDASETTSAYARCWLKYLKQINKPHINGALYDVAPTHKKVVPPSDDELEEDAENLEDGLDDDFSDDYEETDNLV